MKAAALRCTCWGRWVRPQMEARSLHGSVDETRKDLQGSTREQGIPRQESHALSKVLPHSTPDVVFALVMAVVCRPRVCSLGAYHDDHKEQWEIY